MLAPNNIKGQDQLKHYAKNRPEDLLQMINQLREERDTGITCIHGYNDVVEKQHEAVELLNRSQARVTSVTKSYREELQKSVLLQARVHELEEKETSSSRSNSQPPWETSATPHSQAARNTQTFPDPPIFTNGEDPTWEGWQAKMMDKLDINDDHYPSEVARMAYAVSRLGGDAFEHTYARRRPGNPDPYQSVDDILHQLEDIYGDPDRVRKSRRQYNALRQENQPFNVFYSEFIKLSSYLDYNSSTLMDDLRDKLNRRLQDALTVCPTQFETLSTLKNYLQSVDNQQRSNMQQRQDSVRNTGRPLEVRTRAAAPTTPTPRTVPVQTQPTERDSIMAQGLCFKCKQPGHIARNCVNPPTSGNTNPRQPERAHRMHEISPEETKNE